MSDLGAGGTVDFSNLPAYSIRSQQTNTTDIRRTVAPQPTVIGTFHVLNSAGFSGAGDVIKGTLPGVDTTTLNQGVLFRVVDNNTTVGHVGITKPGAGISDAVMLEEGDEIFIPAERLNDIIIGHTTATSGITFSALGE